VFRDDNRIPSIEELDLTGPGPGEALVRITATGVCHTDLKSAGAGVTKLAPGDTVKPLLMMV